MDQSLSLSLPVCPSVNALYCNVLRHGRVKSEKYKTWENRARLSLWQQPFFKIPGATEITILLPATLRGDIDNRAKATIDFLVKHNIIDDDRNVTKLTIKKQGGEEDTQQVTIKN